jgi:SRSO17 transposase
VPADGHAAWSESFNELFAQVAGNFSNARVRRHGRAYLLGLLSQAERKTSWQLAEFAGDASPDGMQRLLNFSPWDEDACRDALARYVTRAWAIPGRCWRSDETGFLKKGRMSAGVARQYTGTAGRVENCQVGVFLAYCAPDGARALIDRELYLPAKWTEDRERCRAAGIGDEVPFATKPELAKAMIARAVRRGSRSLGGRRRGLRRQPELREWLEERQKGYVLAVACNATSRRWPGRSAPTSSPPWSRRGVAAAELRRRVQGAAALRLGAHRHRGGPAPAGPPVPAAGRERRA